MLLPRPVQERLLGSIEAHNLVLLCGAGLSIPDPSNLMSAVAVARKVYDEYAPTLVLPAPLRLQLHRGGRFRRVSPIASGRSDDPLSDHRAGGQPAQRELVFMPLKRPCWAGSEPAEFGWTRH